MDEEEIARCLGCGVCDSDEVALAEIVEDGLKGVCESRG